MKLNKNLKTVLSNIDLIITSIMYIVLIVVMAFYPKASVFQMVFGAIVLIIIQALLRLKNIGQESILNGIKEELTEIKKSIPGGGIPKPDGK